MRKKDCSEAALPKGICVDIFGIIACTEDNADGMVDVGEFTDRAEFSCGLDNMS